MDIFSYFTHFSTHPILILNNLRKSIRNHFLKGVSWYDFFTVGFFAELRCDSEAAKLECVEYPRSVSHRTPPCTFFCKCIPLQAAIDFAALRMRSWRRRHGANSGAWTLSATPAYHIAAHHANFSTSAFCKLQLILRCKWWGGMQHVLRRGRLCT